MKDNSHIEEQPKTQEVPTFPVLPFGGEDFDYYLEQLLKTYPGGVIIGNTLYTDDKVGEDNSISIPFSSEGDTYPLDYNPNN